MTHERFITRMFYLTAIIGAVTGGSALMIATMLMAGMAMRTTAPTADPCAAHWADGIECSDYPCDRETPLQTASAPTYCDDPRCLDDWSAPNYH
jgi:hypothetical protein